MRPSYKHPPKPVDRPDNISVLIPTRGRPDGLQKVFENFQNTVEVKALFDVWLYVDDDDSVTIDFINSGIWKRYDFAINWHIDRGTGSMGEMFNRLWQNCTTNPGLYFPFPDDYLIATPNWDSVLREYFHRFDDGIMLGYLPDPTAQPHQVTFAIPSAKWLNLLGYFITSRFYYWFDDAWLDDIATMVNRKVLIPISLHVPEGKGKTPRMRNLPFWNGYFSNTIHERYLDACNIIKAICTGDSAAFEDACLQAKQVAAALIHKRNTVDDAILNGMEAACRDFDSIPRAPQVTSYLQTELHAVEDLLEMVHSEVVAGNHADIIELTTTLGKSTVHIPDIAYLKAISLDRLGFFSDALACLQKEISSPVPEPKTIELAVQLVKKTSSLEEAYGKSLSCLRLPAWLDMPEHDFIVFPDKIDHDLYYYIQRLLYDDDSIRTIVDIGSGNGRGSTDAVLTAVGNKAGVLFFCIEPDTQKFTELQQHSNTRAICYNGSSVALNDYMSEKGLSLFYEYIPSIINFYSLTTVIGWRHQELNDIITHRISESCIDMIKKTYGMTRFDLAILDGSMFVGEPDLDAVYGSTYIVLNYILSPKNHANFKRLLQDPAYGLIGCNRIARCGYAIFKRNTEFL